MYPERYKLTRLVNARTLLKLQSQLARRVGATVLTVDENLRTVVAPDGFCIACRLCFEPDNALRVPLPAGALQGAAGGQGMPSPPCPAGLGFLSYKLMAGGASLGSVLLGIVCDVQTFESRLFELSKDLGERPREIAMKYFNETRPDRHDFEQYREELEIAGAAVLGLAVHAINDRPDANYLAFLENLSRLIPRRSTLEEGITALLVHACTVFGADAGAFVFKKDPQARPVVFPHNLSPHFIEHFLGDETMGGASDQVKRPLRLPALGNTFPWNNPSVAEENINSLICIPLNAQEGSGTGMFYLFGFARGQFEGVDLVQVGLVGREAVAHWERADLRESLQSQARQMAALQAVIRAGGDDQQVMLQQFVDLATVLGNSQVCAVFLRKEDGTDLELAVTRPLKGDNVGEYDLNSMGRLAKEAHRTGRLLATEGLAAGEKPRSAGRQGTARQALRSVLAIPLEAGETNLGAVVLGSTQSDVHTPDVVRVVELLARAGTFSLTNIQAQMDFKRMHFETVTALATALDATDPYLGQHSLRVAKYALTMAIELGLSQRERDLIYEAGLLHDIGSLSVPRDLLNKPDALSDEELRIVQTHPLRGFEIVSRVRGLEEVALMVRHHHERFDGKGYPDGLAGGAIPVGARILAVAEAFDAMTSNRPFRRALSVREALMEVIQGIGAQFDREVVSAFAQSLRRPEFQEAIRDNKEAKLTRGGLSKLAMKMLVAANAGEDQPSATSIR